MFSGNDERNRHATMFYKIISRIPFFRYIVTTNWDPFCERSLNVLVPMVEDKDIPFWDESKRQILKIHGCISRPHTIVATTDDYESCMKDRSKGAIFTKLRDLMATKTFIFVGYSVSDPDFQLIYDEVIKNLGEFRRGAYVVDPKPSDDSIVDWKKRNVQIIKLFGYPFAQKLVKEVEKRKLIPSVNLISGFIDQQDRIIKIHIQTSDDQERESAISSAMYQDGLLHEIEYLIDESMRGKSFKELRDRLVNHEKHLKKCWYYTNNPPKSAEDKPNFAFVEVAYWTGKVEALSRFIDNNKRNIPAFFGPYSMIPQRVIRSLNIDPS